MKNYFLGNLEMCKKRGIVFNQNNVWNGNLWELNSDFKLHFMTVFKSASGQKFYVRQLGFEHGQYVNENWDSKHDNSVEWVCNQCKMGLGYGAFILDKGNNNILKDKQPVSWFIACKYVIYLCM